MDLEGITLLAANNSNISLLKPKRFHSIEFTSIGRSFIKTPISSN